VPGRATGRSLDRHHLGPNGQRSVALPVEVVASAREQRKLSMLD
jgi:hypothetical protein